MNCENKLNVLLEFGKVISNERNLNKVVDILADISRDVTEADRCSIYIYDKDKKILWTKVAQEIDKIIKLPLGKGVAGDVALTQKIKIIPDVYDEKKFDKSVDNSTGYITKQMIALPIINKKKETLGVIQVLNKKVGKFGDEDLDALLLIASYAAAIIENSILHKNLEQKVESEVNKNKKKDLIIFQQSRLVAMGEMISAIAHNWRQPLNAIGLIISDIKDAFIYDELDEEYLQRSVKNANKLLTFMSDTINDFKDFFKVEEEKQYFSVDMAVNHAVSLILAQFKSQEIDININNNLEIKNSENLELFSYLSKFEQAIVFLLKNARDAVIEKRDIDKSYHKGNIDIDIFKENSTIIVTIRDDGVGIEEKILDRIFEPYFTTKEQGKGVGMGLYIVKMIIENNMNGKIFAKNGDETEFRIEFKSA